MSEANPLISVIVPVYKTEQYLHRCVDSILAQTYTNLEIILVDDGSPDNCPAICDEYATKDSRIKVIHKPNGGVSSARNAGLDAATGEFICFVDSDDSIDEKMLEKLIEYFDDDIDDDIDVTICQFEDYGNNEHNDHVKLDHLETLKRGFSRSISKDYYLDIYPCIWGKLYRASIWENVRFDTSLSLAEDELAWFQVALNVRNSFRISDILYYYNNIAGSLIQSVDSGRIYECVCTADLIALECCKTAEHLDISLAKLLFDEVQLTVNSANKDKFIEVRSTLVRRFKDYSGRLKSYRGKYIFAYFAILLCPDIFRELTRRNK